MGFPIPQGLWLPSLGVTAPWVFLLDKEDSIENSPSTIAGIRVKWGKEGEGSV